MRLVTSPPCSLASRTQVVAPALLPFRPGQLEEIHLHGFQVEDGGRRYAVQPAARLAWIDDQRVAAHANLAPVRVTMDYHRVMLDGPDRRLTELVHDED